jgi:hypothetical protein
MENEMDGDDFELVKNKYNKEVEALEATLFSNIRTNIDLQELKKLARDALKQLVNLHTLYESAGTAGKRYIIKTIFSARIEFREEKPRSTSVNQFAKYFYLRNLAKKISSDGKGGEDLKLVDNQLTNLSITETFIKDLKLLTSLPENILKYDLYAKELTAIKKGLIPVPLKKKKIGRMRKKRLLRKIAIKKWLLTAV